MHLNQECTVLIWEMASVHWLSTAHHVTTNNITKYIHIFITIHTICIPLRHTPTRTILANGSRSMNYLLEATSTKLRYVENVRCCCWRWSSSSSSLSYTRVFHASLCPFAYWIVKYMHIYSAIYHQHINGQRRVALPYYLSASLSILHYSFPSVYLSLTTIFNCARCCAGSYMHICNRTAMALATLNSACYISLYYTCQGFFFIDFYHLETVCFVYIYIYVECSLYCHWWGSSCLSSS